MTTPVDTIAVDVVLDTRAMSEGLARLSREAASFSSAVTGAFRSAVVGGRALDDVLRDLALRFATIAFDAAMQPLSNAIGTAFAGLTGGGPRLFARGGIVDGPTLFPMAGGTGLAGEAGAEAILPLSRGADGRLGVRAEAGARPVSVTVNVTTPDAESFRRSEAQVTAMLARAVGRGRRGL